jgi:peptide deformylase
MILKVSCLGHPVLRGRAKAVPIRQIATLGMSRFVEDLIETMREYEGVGIAAPQVHVPLQVAVIGAQKNRRYPLAPPLKQTVLFNPKVGPIGRAKSLDWEGCLSVPGWRGRVPRWRSVQIKAYNLHGEPVQFRASGFFARVIQHEWDHLQGRVYLDRMSNLTTLTHLEEFERYWVKG